MQLCRFGRGLHFFIACCRLTVTNVVANIVVKQHGVLRHDANTGTNRVLGQVANVLTINSNGTFAHVVKSVQQTRQRGFSAAGMSNNGQGFSRINLETDAM